MPKPRLHRRLPGTLVLGTSLVIASAAAAPSASAEEPASPAPAPRAMTLKDAIAHARERHPELVAARARVAAARADAAVPRAQWLPSIGGVAQLLASTINNSTATVLSSPLVDLPRIGATPVVSAAEASLVPYPTTYVALGIRQTVFDFGRIGIEAAAFDRIADAESLRADTVGLDVSLAVAQAYYAVLAAQEVVKASERALERARAHRDQAKAAVSAQMRSPIELTRAEADVARFELGRVRAEGTLKIARGAFAAAVGVPEAELDAEGPKPAAGAPAPAAEEAAPAPLPSLRTVLEKAEANEPLLKAAGARVEAQKALTAAIGAQLRPRLFATASISGRSGGAEPSSGPAAQLGGWVPEVPNWSVGLVFSWPIFDATVSARESASRAREDAARAELYAARQRVRARAQQVYQEAEVASKALAALRPAADAATANYAQAEARFHAGFGSSLELADAEILRTQAEIDLAVGDFQQSRTRSALERATVEGGLK